MKHNFILSGLLLALTLGACKTNNEAGSAANGQSTLDMVAEGAPEVAEVTGAPKVPAPIGDRGPKKLIVNLETTEITGEIADGKQYTFWTFNNTVPGSFIRVREGDEVELHLKNAANSVLPHNIDLHA